jgi:hypothetical protein
MGTAGRANRGRQKSTRWSHSRSFETIDRLIPRQRLKPTLTGRSSRVPTSGGRDRKRSIRVFHETLNASKVVRQSRWSIYCTGEEPSVPVQPVERKLAAIFAADIAGGRNRTLGQPPDKRPHRLGPPPARLRNGQVGGKGNS